MRYNDSVISDALTSVPIWTVQYIIARLTIYYIYILPGNSCLPMSFGRRTGLYEVFRMTNTGVEV